MTNVIEFHQYYKLCLGCTASIILAKLGHLFSNSTFYVWPGNGARLF